MLGRPGSLFRVVLHFSVWACFVSCLRMIIDIQLDELVHSGQSAQWQFLFCTLWITLWCNKKGFVSTPCLVEGSLMQWKSEELLNKYPLHPLWHFLYHLPLHNCPSFTLSIPSNWHHSHNQFQIYDYIFLEIVIYPIWRLKPILNLYIYKTININYQSI